MSELLLGLDLGTSSSKAVLCTPEGRVVASAVREHSLSLPRPGWVELDAERVWWHDSVALVRELVDQVPPGDVVAMCVSGCGPCLLLCDEDLRPLHPAILYGIDTRSVVEVEELTERYGEDAILASCGNALTSQSIGPKLAWLRRHEPEAWRRARGFFGSSSFLVARLTGEYVVDHHTASQSDPFYDLRSRSWNSAWVTDVCGELPLPRLVWPTDVVGGLSASAAAQTGLCAGLPVCAGTVDAWAEAFSAGVRSPGEAMMMYGSTMCLIQPVAEVSTHPLLWATNGVQPEGYTLSGAMATSGTLLSWLRGLTGGASYAELTAEARGVPVGSDGLVVLPYLAGERTPLYDPQARGVLAGLSLRHSRGHLMRAAYEGISFGMRQIIDLFEDLAPARMVAVGGGTEGGLWPQILSDVCGREQVVPHETIGASYGDALLAGIGCGLLDAGTDWSRAERVVTPDPARRAAYDALYPAFLDLYPATRPVVHRLADLQR